MTVRALALPQRPRGRRIALHILADDLATEVDEDLVDVGSSASRGLVVRGVAPALGEGECAGARHGPVFFQIGFVADDDEWHFLVVFDADDLLAELREFVE